MAGELVASVCQRFLVFLECCAGEGQLTGCDCKLLMQLVQLEVITQKMVMLSDGLYAPQLSIVAVASTDASDGVATCNAARAMAHTNGAHATKHSMPFPHHSVLSSAASHLLSLCCLLLLERSHFTLHEVCICAQLVILLCQVSACLLQLP
jgi:hypothetical protein